MVMPALFWVAFWSWMMGSAACLGQTLGETTQAIRVKAREPRD
jgi:hypothetical protein